MKTMPASPFIVLSLLAFSLVAFAQQPEKVGDLIDKGGKKLTKDEIAKLVTGATIKGAVANAPTWKYEGNFRSDGSLSGSARPFVGQGIASFSGKWWLNDQGQICSDTLNSANARTQRCDFWFNLGNAYFSAATDDRTATVLEREVNR